MLKIQYDSKYKEICQKIVEEINTKLDTYKIYLGELKNKKEFDVIEEVTEGFKQQDRSIPSKPYHLLSYENMLHRLDQIKSLKFKISTYNPDNYYYALLCFSSSLMNDYKTLNDVEKALATNLLGKNGVFFDIINDTAFTMVGIKKDFIE